jgi:hypothetical protein
MDISPRILKEIENAGLALISAHNVLKYMLPETWTHMSSAINIVRQCNCLINGEMLQGINASL